MASAHFNAYGHVASGSALPVSQASLRTTKAPFKPPAHKHAHHLHSIPPKEKSTRTLIIDHMLWVHGRTRFAQVRAELGMTDRTGDSSSDNYVHRFRPENFEEDDQQQSDGEEVNVLMATSSGSHSNDEEVRRKQQDLGLAKSLRLRAESLEKVVTSMLDQPPAIHPVIEDDLLTLPPSPAAQPQPTRRERHPHTLPNGVRLRLALDTVINDLFSRSDIPQPNQNPPRQESRAGDFTSGTRPLSTLEGGAVTSSNPSGLPAVLMPLSAISVKTHIIAHSILPPPAMPGPNTFVPPSSIEYLTSGFVNVPASATINSHAHFLYATGAGHSSPGQVSSIQCPRHLHHDCQICAEANASPHARGFGREASSTGGITGWKDGSGIGSGLARPGPSGTVLRRAPTKVDGPTAGNAKLSDSLPRFLRLSALVAIELASEAGGEGDEIGWDGSDERRESESAPASERESASPAVRSNGQGPNRSAFQPSKKWYMLLAGLLTRAVLEGYLTAGWTGPEAAECLLTVGFGNSDSSGSRNEKEGTENSGARSDGGEDMFEEFDPDGWPSLEDAARVLFPPDFRQRKGGATGEFQTEMEGRLRKFFDIPQSAPDLSTRLQEIAVQYPAEPVERAAVRFCEAVAKWRGKPELETYKKKPPSSSFMKGNDATNSTAMAMAAFVHSNPTSPAMGQRTAVSVSTPSDATSRRPPIEKYFMPASAYGTFRKRLGSISDLRPGSGKRQLR